MWFSVWSLVLGGLDGDWVGQCLLGFVVGVLCVVGAICGAFAAGFDEPESLILAQSERWRHA